MGCRCKRSRVVLLLVVIHQSCSFVCVSADSHYIVLNIMYHILYFLCNLFPNLI